MENIAYKQFEKAEGFRLLHQRPEIFVVPNPWDAGSTKLLTGLGYRALATTSAGAAYTIGKADGRLTRAEMLENARIIVNSTHLPVSADLEDGYGGSPETCAYTIQMAAEVGLIGGSIGDSTSIASGPIYDFDLSLRRIEAAVESARNLPFHFTLTARAENYLHGINDLEDTIRRLVAFAKAGADVLFAPGVKNKEDIQAIIAAVAPKPVNVLWGFPGERLTINDLAKLGVKRVSTGSSLVRAAFGAFYNGAKEIKSHGTFSYASTAIPYQDINSLLYRETNAPDSVSSLDLLAPNK